jgi:hypothetical protein
MTAPTTARTSVGWTVDRLPTPVGVLLALGVVIAGSLASVLLAVYGGTLTCLYLGVAGIVASGITGMVIGWHLPPADLAREPR